MLYCVGHYEETNSYCQWGILWPIYIRLQIFVIGEIFHATLADARRGFQWTTCSVLKQLDCADDMALTILQVLLCNGTQYARMADGWVI